MKEETYSDERKVTALVPMKGHSERVPNKNLPLFAADRFATEPYLTCKVTQRATIGVRNSKAEHIIDGL